MATKTKTAKQTRKSTKIETANKPTTKATKATTSKPVTKVHKPADDATEAKPVPKKVKLKPQATTEPTAPVSVEPTPAPTANPAKKKLSAIDAAAQVLSNFGPMNCKELIDAMSAQGLWTSPGGKTPQATLYSAILREIVTKGGESRFVKTERGRFATK